MTAANQPQTVQTLSGLLTWYRDIVDDERIAAWHIDVRQSDDAFPGKRSALSR
jgi:hypothetical protein